MFRPASQFYKDASLRDGLRSRCKPCEQNIERIRRGQPPREDAPLRVELLVCPTCKFVGKLPPTFGYRGFCMGADTQRHPKAKMQPRRFVELPQG
jgi:hypothetical protein